MLDYLIRQYRGWHNYSLDYLKTMAAHISSRTNKHTTIVLGNLLRACSFALQRHQGTMLVHTDELVVRRCLGLF
jgi:predicted transcriptional regulator